ncbi:MAG: hypothetical protein PUK54_07940 [Firmicutes bacterium]|nr:hypothetical protein [Bacillota bacterium]MDD7602510.1 hypothetical protein [Bacillota bacterium]MDY5856772.1 hypothetical protein [Anaerovoracaceae bacterium]
MTFAEKIGIQIDGVWSVQEGLLCAAAAVLAVLILVVVIKRLTERAERRKHAIFSNSRNKYKSRLGKKNIKY